MVGALVLAKILHCKRHGIKKRKRKLKPSTPNEGPSRSNTSDIAVKIENQEELLSEQVCRICLKEGRIPILGDINEDLVESINNFGAIEIHPEDPYPKYLCQPCHGLLQGAILFRKTAQQTDKLLKKQTLYTSQEEQNDVINNESDDINNDEIDTEPIATENTSKLTCKRCDMDFNSIEEYTAHRLSPEHENKRIACDICNKTYAPEYFKRHKLTHAKDCSYICDICGKNFIIQSHFTKHRMTHFYELPFKCPLCPYKGRFSESLKMHMRTHTGEKPYQCTSCPSRRFVSKSNLNKHMLTHKEGFDFRCEVCGRGFNTKRNIELHIKADHNGIKEHKCRICGKAFGYRKQMTKHEVKVHKREKMRSGRMPLYLQLESMEQNKNTNILKT